LLSELGCVCVSVSVGLEANIARDKQDDHAWRAKVKVEGGGGLSY